MKIVVRNRFESKLTGKPIGSIIDFEDAPAGMQKRAIAESAPMSEEAKKAHDERVKRDLEFAFNLRESIAKAHGAHAVKLV